MAATTKLALFYSFFALIATITNLASQDLLLYVYEGPFQISLSIFVGTAVGLITKYLLDKRYIFKFETRDISHDGKVFVLYTLMGVATTAIFWGFEFAFHVIFESKGMRYVGGALGLSIGYVTKYQLDKRYVFRQVTA